MCGIIGIHGIDDAVFEIFNGLISLQHRGQDACGMHTWDGKSVRVKKGHGLVADVFQENHFRKLKGRSGIGHVRYATVGDGDSRDIQPLYESEFFVASYNHNGNLTNFSKLRELFGNFGSSCDLEAILKTSHTDIVTSSLKHDIIKAVRDMPAESSQEEIIRTIQELEIAPSIDMSSDRAIDFVLDSVRKVMQTCEGSYSVIGNIPGLGMMGFKDPYGIKPLVVGMKQTDKGVAHAFASETVAFQLPLGYDLIKEIEPGSIFLVRGDGSVIERQLVNGKTASPCIFELLYFASPVSSINGVSVSEYRYQSGKVSGMDYMDRFSRQVSQEMEGRIICGSIPSASVRGAAGFSEVTGIPERDIFIRNNYLKRGFILPDRKAREQNAMLKLPIDLNVLQGVETVVLIDDSIVRGDTSKNLIYRLRTEAERHSLPLKNIHFISLSPPNRHPCPYGIDMAIDKELIAASRDIESVRQYIGADYLQYQRIGMLGVVLDKLLGCEKSTYCDACFSGDYPTGLTSADLKRISDERIADKGCDYG